MSLDGKTVIPQLETPQDAAVISSRHHNPAFHPPASQTLFCFDDAASLVTLYCHVMFTRHSVAGVAVSVRRCV